MLRNKQPISLKSELIHKITKQKKRGSQSEINNCSSSLSQPFGREHLRKQQLYEKYSKKHKKQQQLSAMRYSRFWKHFCFHKMKMLFIQFKKHGSNVCASKQMVRSPWKTQPAVTGWDEPGSWAHLLHSQGLQCWSLGALPCLLVTLVGLRKHETSPLKPCPLGSS